MEHDEVLEIVFRHIDQDLLQAYTTVTDKPGEQIIDIEVSRLVRDLAGIVGKEISYADIRGAVNEILLDQRRRSR